jgi:hypothetical protein
MIDHVFRRTRPLSVTALSSSPQCDMRVLLESERCSPTLPMPPEAILGSIIHDALDQCGEQGSEQVLARVKAALVGESGSFCSHANVSGSATLREVISATRLSAKLATARKIANAIPQSSRKGKRAPRSPSAASNSASHHPLSRGHWREVGLTSPELELTGRIDSMDVGPGECRIADFKTGRALDHDGKVRANYVDQLHLYMILARRMGYGPRYNLVVIAPDGNFDCPVDEQRLHGLENRVESLVRSVPKNKPTLIDSLAHVCQSCATCRYRPSCKSYLAEAPKLWPNQARAFPMPSDIWGDIVKIEPDAGDSGFMTVHLRDAATRLCCVSGVPDRFKGKPICVGSKVGFFDLQGLGTESPHPQNFCLGVPGNPRASRHTARIVGLSAG